MAIPQNTNGASSNAPESVQNHTSETTSLDEIKDVADAAGKTVVAAALAGAVATGAAAVTPDQIHLPDPTPLVQTFDQGQDQPDSTIDNHASKKATNAKRLLKILKYAILALFFVAAFLFGILQGCASCSGTLAAPFASSEDTSSSASASSRNAA